MFVPGACEVGRGWGGPAASSWATSPQMHNSCRPQARRRVAATLRAAATKPPTNPPSHSTHTHEPLAHTTSKNPTARPARPCTRAPQAGHKQPVHTNTSQARNHTTTRSMANAASHRRRLKGREACVRCTLSESSQAGHVNEAAKAASQRWRQDQPPT
jgi:hypothetical protein